MVGLDAAGKTTILYKLKLGEIVTTIPTIGNVLVLYFSFPIYANIQGCGSGLAKKNVIWGCVLRTKRFSKFFYIKF